MWDEMPPVGRELESPDFDRLVAEDHAQGEGVFDPAFEGMSATLPRAANGCSERTAIALDDPSDLR
jgi:hypothetical protein